MLGAAIDLVIGLILVYFLFSLLTSGINEVIAKWTNLRAKHLEAGVGKLLGELTDEFFAHPTIRGLSDNKGWVPLRPGAGPSPQPRKPSYIPSSTFSTALLSIVAAHASTDKPTGAGHEPSLPDITHLDRWLNDVPNSDLKRTLQLLLTEAGNDLDRFRHGIEKWFDDAMERVSGWYKRNAKRAMLVIGLAVAVAGNVDTVLLAKTLWTDGPLRDSVVAQAQNVAGAPSPTATVSTPTPVGTPTPGTGPPPSGSGSSTTSTRAACPAPLASPSASAQGAPPGDSVACLVQQVEAIQQLHIPIGWSTQKSDPRVPDDAAQWVVKIIGLVATAVALSFGAPFWFDLLGKLINLRSTGRRPSPSGGGDAPPTKPTIIGQSASSEASG